MPTQFERYRMKDGITPLAGSYFNPIWQDVDVRLAALEEVRASWNDAVATLTTYGLLRINEITGPSVAEMQAAIAAAEQLLEESNAALSEAVTNNQAALDASLAAVEAATAEKVAALSAALETVGQFLPPMTAGDEHKILVVNSEGKLSLVEPVCAHRLAYSDRALLRTLEHPWTLAVVDGLGLFAWEAGSGEPDDDETCFATENGRWLIQAVHWDLARSYLQPELDQAFTSLSGEFFMSYTSFGPLSAGAFTVTISGALPGDHVLVTPGNAIGKEAADQAKMTVSAHVSAADTVIVSLRNPSTAAATLVPAWWRVLVIKERG